MPVEEIGKLVHELSPKALFHVDAIQAFGKIPYTSQKSGDRPSFRQRTTRSTDPREWAFLYISEKAKVQPLILGGGQQNGMRSGTDNVPGIAGLGAAAEEIYRDLEKNNEHLYSLKEYIAKGLERITGYQDQRNAPKRRRAPDFEHQRHGSEKRSPSARAGGQGDLCLSRKRLLKPQAEAQRHTVGDGNVRRSDSRARCV